MFGIIGWIFFGLIVGVIAKLLMPGRDPGGMIVTVLIGIAGALFGGFIGRAIGMYGPGEVAGYLMSIVGAMLLLFIYRRFLRSHGPDVEVPSVGAPILQDGRSPPRGLSWPTRREPRHAGPIELADAMLSAADWQININSNTEINSVSLQSSMHSMNPARPRNTTPSPGPS